jgi:hypothetical protein
LPLALKPIDAFTRITHIPDKPQCLRCARARRIRAPLILHQEHSGKLFFADDASCIVWQAKRDLLIRIIAFCGACKKSFAIDRNDSAQRLEERIWVINDLWIDRDSPPALHHRRGYENPVFRRKENTTAVAALGGCLNVLTHGIALVRIATDYLHKIEAPQ